MVQTSLAAAALNLQFEYASKFDPMSVFSDPALMDAALDPEVGSTVVYTLCGSAEWSGRVGAAAVPTPFPLGCAPFHTEQAMKAVSEVVEDPSKLDNWRHKPQLHALLKKMLGR